MLKISYREADRRAVLTWDVEDDEAPWLIMLCRLAFDKCDDTQREGAFQLSLPWWAFSSVRPDVLDIFKGFRLSIGSHVLISDRAQELLRRATRNAHSYSAAANAGALAEAELLTKLDAIRFDMQLKPYQIRNVCKIAALPAGATFSVPGAGKTIEALACFFYRATDADRLLVIAPKNAFASWDEHIEKCMPHLGQGFIRLRGGRDKIARLLSDQPRFMLITYQQLTRVRDIIASCLAEHPVYVYLDESHRIKSGVGRQIPETVLSLSHLPVGKLIMSGTPMPQSVDDLIPQFTFLYPEVPVSSERVINMIQPIYVRTNKDELGLKPVCRKLKRLPMGQVQHELYMLMKSEVAREAASALSTKSRQAFRRLGRSVARLLQFVSNPSLLSSEIGFAHPDLLRAVLAEGDGPKLQYVLKKVRKLAADGHKVLIWSSYVRNVEYIAARLGDLGAVYIHGGVDAGDEDDDETREGRIKLFHDDKDVKVMVANPAAASEGISLHKVCHHAIYLDRTFNAAHYLQSEDRIHRVGLEPDENTTIEIVECIGTVDETVNQRLIQKVEAMAEALSDSSLRIDPIPLDPGTIDDPDEYVTGLGEEDIRAIIRDFAKENDQ